MGHNDHGINICGVGMILMDNCHAVEEHSDRVTRSHSTCTQDVCPMTQFGSPRKQPPRVSRVASDSPRVTQVT